MKLTTLTENSINKEATTLSTNIAKELCAYIGIRNETIATWVAQQAYYKILPQFTRLKTKYTHTNHGETLLTFVAAELHLYDQWIKISQYITKDEQRLTTLNWDEAYAEAQKDEEQEELTSS